MGEAWTHASLLQIISNMGYQNKLTPKDWFWKKAATYLHSLFILTKTFSIPV
jgi:hypothetical protein